MEKYKTFTHHSSHPHSNLLSAPSFKPSRRMPSSDLRTLWRPICRILLKKTTEKAPPTNTQVAWLVSTFVLCLVCGSLFVVFFKRILQIGRHNVQTQNFSHIPQSLIHSQFPSQPRHRPEPDDVHVTTRMRALRPSLLEISRQFLRSLTHACAHKRSHNQTAMAR